VYVFREKEKIEAIEGANVENISENSDRRFFVFCFFVFSFLSVHEFPLCVISRRILEAF